MSQFTPADDLPLGNSATQDSGKPNGSLLKAAELQNCRGPANAGPTFVKRSRHVSPALSDAGFFPQSDTTEVDVTSRNAGTDPSIVLSVVARSLTRKCIEPIDAAAGVCA